MANWRVHVTLKNGVDVKYDINNRTNTRTAEVEMRRRLQKDHPNEQPHIVRTFRRTKVKLSSRPRSPLTAEALAKLISAELVQGNWGDIDPDWFKYVGEPSEEDDDDHYENADIGELKKILERVVRKAKKKYTLD